MKSEIGTLHKQVKQTNNLSPRIAWLRDYYFKGVERAWQNDSLSFSTGTPWDVQYNELNYYIVPETYAFFQTFRSSYRQTAQTIPIPENFWNLSIVERRALFNKSVLTEHLPQEILPGDLIAGGRFNLHTSACLTKSEQKAHDALVLGKKGARKAIFDFHYHGFGNCGPTSGHLIPDYALIVRNGFQKRYASIQDRYNELDTTQKAGKRGAQLKAMMTACEIPQKLAEAYAGAAEHLAVKEKDPKRKAELQTMVNNLKRVPWEGAENFWEAVQSLWITHMLVMSDENYPGPGVSFGRIDQFLLPYWETSKKEGMSREFAKDILKCFWIHANTAYDSMIRVGNQGITAGFGQLFSLAGMGKGGSDCTNELTYIFLEVIDEMSPILEPKPNVRLHRKSPEKLVDTVIDMIATSLSGKSG